MPARLLAIVGAAFTLMIAAPAVRGDQQGPVTADVESDLVPGDSEPALTDDSGDDSVDTTSYKIGLAVGRFIPIALIVGLFLWYRSRRQRR